MQLKLVDSKKITKIAKMVDQTCAMENFHDYNYLVSNKKQFKISEYEGRNNFKVVENLVKMGPYNYESKGL